MTVLLNQSVRIGGVVAPANTRQSLARAVESDLVVRGVASAVDADITAGRALLLGDSIAAYSEVLLSAASVTDRGNNTATVVISGGHGSAVGQPVRLGATLANATNALDGSILAVASSTEFTASLGERKHAVTAPSGPTVAFPDRRSGRGFWTAFETLLGYQFRTTWCAIGGATAAEVLQVARVSDPGPYVIACVCAGMNNVYSEDQSFSTAWAEIKALIDYAREQSPITVVLGIPPRDSGGGAWSAGKQTVHNRLNRQISLYCAERGLVYIDTWRAAFGGNTVVNAAATNPDPLASMTFDGTHTSMPGAFAIATSMYSRLASLLPGAAFSPAHKAQLGADVGNILTDSDFSTGSPTPTGWSITNITTNATATGSVESRTVADHGDAVGKNALVTFAYGTATGQASFRFARSASIHASLVAGKKFKAYVPFSITGGLDIQGVDLLFQGTIGGGQTWQVVAASLDSNADGFAGLLSGVLETPGTLIPAGITALTPFLRVSFGSGQTASAVLRVWHPVFRMYD